MPGVRSKRYMYIVLPLIAIFYLGVWFMKTYYLRVTLNYQEAYSENGVWDLRDFDFSSGYVRLTGYGATIPNALLSPEAFELRSSEAVFGMQDGAQVNTTRLQILLPDDGMYMVSGHSMGYSERIYLNGVLRQDVGQVSLDPDDCMPSAVYLNLEAQARSGQLEVMRQSSNFAHWIIQNPVDLTVGSSEVMRRVVSIETDFAGAVMGILFSLFLIHGLFYIILRKYRVNLYFALLCLVWCLHFGITGVMPIASWFPGTYWYAYLRIDYLLSGSNAVLLLLITHESFPGALPRWYTRANITFTAALFVAVLVSPIRFLSVLWVPFAAGYTVLILLSGGFLIVYIRTAARLHAVLLKKRIILYSMLLLFATMIQEMAYQVGLIPNLFADDLGILMFGFFLMAANFYGTVRAIENAYQAEREAAAIKRVGRIQEEFLHELSHELQAPLTVVSGFAQLTDHMMEDEVTDRAEVRSNMRRLAGEADRMGRMVNQLLDMAAIENDSMQLRCEAVDLGALVREVATVHFPVMDGGGNKVVVRAEPGLTVNGDRERLLQVLLNLLSNAVRYTENGVVTLTAERADGMAAVTVADTGDGFPEELLPVLFQRFVGRRTTDSNGLGLYICMKLVKAQGGRIYAENRPEGSAVVRFHIPL